MRVAILTGAGLAILAIAGCGGDDPEPRKPEPRVRLEITAPADLATVRRGTVDVRGRVTPASATVRVLGRPALVSEGGFTVVVPLEPGANVVDVAATARGRRPALMAIRVTRDQRVAVPDLVGADEDEARSSLDRRGLEIAVENGGSFFDRFVPQSPAVCEQEPAAGARVPRGTVVRVVVARAC